MLENQEGTCVEDEDDDQVVVCGHTLRDKKKNEVIHERVGVTPIEEKMREARLRGRPKKNWGEVIRQDMTQVKLIKDMAFDRSLYKSRIRVEDQVFYASFLF